MNTQIYEEASNWFVDFRAGDVEAARCKEFDAWIRKSPEHLRAYLEITEIWQDAPFADSKGVTSADELVELAMRTDRNVIALQVAASGVPGESKLSRDPRAGGEPVKRRRLIGLAASVLLATLGTLTWYWFEYQRSNTYSTGTGEQRLINLVDGSTIQLNAQSKVRVNFSDMQRNVDLIGGQALFHVAKNKARPFIVQAGDTRVRAVGTQFDVYRRRTGTTVTVVEGRVAVIGASSTFGAASSDAQGEPERLLSAGEQVTVIAQAASPVQKTNVANATAWTQHRLVFKSSPLVEVAEEFNRYNTRRLVIQGSELSDFHVSGVYSSTDPSLLLRFLREQRGIRIRETEAEILISRAP